MAEDGQVSRAGGPARDARSGPLPDLRAWEQRFGIDFSRVRTHSDDRAARSAHSVGAAAYTLGDHIVFGAGMYAPATGPGDRLLCHELVHVVQQRRGGIAPPRGGRSDSEREAVAVTGAFAAGASRLTVSQATGIGIARQSAMDPRHARGAAGEQGMAFVHYRLEGDWVIIEGPSGTPEPGTKGSGHAVTQVGFDAIAYNTVTGEVHLTDNKSLKSLGAVRSSTALTANLAKNVDAAIGRLEAARDIKGRIKVLGILKRTRAALNSGTPLPHEVRLVVTGEGGRSTEVNPKLKAMGVEFHGSGAPHEGKPFDEAAAIEQSQAVKKYRQRQSQKGLTGGGGPAGATQQTSGVRPGTLGASRTLPDAGSTAARAKIIASANASITRAAALGERLAGYLKAYQSLMAALDALETIKDMLDLLAQGTTLREQQRNADQVLSDAERAKAEADAVLDDISLFALFGQVNAAERRGDDHWLTELVTTLIEFTQQLETAERKAREYAEGIASQADVLRKMEAEARRRAERQPGFAGAAAGAEYVSLDPLAGTVQSAARVYNEAADTLHQQVEQFDALTTAINNRAWDIARARAIERQKAVDEAVAAAYEAAAALEQLEHEPEDTKPAARFPMALPH
jgi:hypothetical protein